MAQKRSRREFEKDLQKQQAPFVVYGTPLPPLDVDARDDGSYVPVWKQEVTDDRGRKRLHGAFTGGFSAGYFNTVGSKEGWTPSTFTSSRSNRAKTTKNPQQQRPEDFMDDEDIREQEESRQLSTNTDYAGFGTQDDPRHRNALMELFRPAQDSVGFKLLNRMGWRKGQGIGPRVHRKAVGDEDAGEIHLLAPDDAPMISFNKKTNTKGLGCNHNGQAESKEAQLSAPKREKEGDSEGDEDEDDRPGLNFARSKKKAVKSRKGGFGVGILNDTGSDEDDPYSMGPKISYNRMLGSDKKLKKKATGAFGSSNPLLKQNPTFVSKRLSSMQHALRRCHDGRLPLAGFVLADELNAFSSMNLTDDDYKPPEVPTDWQPARLQNSDASNIMNTNQPATEYQSTADAAKQSSHTSTTRANLLGEKSLPGKSIFDFMTPAARAKLVNATGKIDLPPALSEHLTGAPNPSQKPSSEPPFDIPFLDSMTAKSAISRAESGGFMPYAEDLDKRGRYKQFLEISAGLHEEGKLPTKPSTIARDEEWLNELHEFVRAAEVFRPMTGAIASRFTSGTSSAGVIDPSSHDANGADGGSGMNSTLLRKPVSKTEDPAEVAAKLGMFGVMTRSTSSFQPTRLVCKRFGVDMPMYMPPESGQSAVPSYVPGSVSTKNNNTTSQMNLVAQSDKFVAAGYVTDGKEEPAKSTLSPSSLEPGLQTNPGNEGSQKNVPQQVIVTIDPDRNDALEQQRPGQEVFKAIFGDSDSDDD